MSLSSVSLLEDSVGDAPIPREVQTAPLIQQDQSRHRGEVYFGSGHLAKKSVRKREWAMEESEERKGESLNQKEEKLQKKNSEEK